MSGKRLCSATRIRLVDLVLIVGGLTLGFTVHHLMQHGHAYVAGGLVVLWVAGLALWGQVRQENGESEE